MNTKANQTSNKDILWLALAGVAVMFVRTSDKKSANSKLEMPSGKVPRKWLLRTCYWISYGILVFGLAMLIHSVQLWSNLEPVRLLFVMGITVAIGGGVLTSVASSTFRKYYQYVAQGEIVNLYLHSGYHSTVIDHMVVVEGYTRAGEIRRYSHGSNATYWQQARIGDTVRFT